MTPACAEPVLWRPACLKGGVPHKLTGSAPRPSPDEGGLPAAPGAVPRPDPVPELPADAPPRGPPPGALPWLPGAADLLAAPARRADPAGLHAGHDRQAALSPAAGGGKHSPLHLLLLHVPGGGRPQGGTVVLKRSHRGPRGGGGGQGGAGGPGVGMTMGRIGGESVEWELPVEMGDVCTEWMW